MILPKESSFLQFFTEFASSKSCFDPGGYWWPPTYSTWTPTIVSFNFLVSLIVAQFTVFGSFRVLNFRSRFEALNNVFSASNGRANMSPFWTQYLLFMDVFLEEIFLMMYHVRQMEVVCQSYDPEKLMYQVTQWGPHSGVSPPFDAHDTLLKRSI